MTLSIKNIAGTLGLPAPAVGCNISHLLTDSRSLESAEDSLFFAIPTKGNDGHRFISDLYSHGVRNFVVNRVPRQFAHCIDANFLVVPDTVEALQRIAARRPDFGGHILAITGSRGKTTLKEWIFQLMEPLSDISRSPRSYNSQIGVPLSMWDIEPAARLAVIEAGISRPDEMSPLAACIQPDTVIITNIGEAHSDGFADDAAKAREKARLAAAPSVGTVVFRKDYTLISEALDAVAPAARRFTWSDSDTSADVLIATERTPGETRVTYTYRGETSTLTAPLDNDADIENAANALCFMLLSGIGRDVIASRFAHLHKIGTRLNVSEGVNGCSVIHDSYTSDFSSLRPALDFMRRRKTPRQSLTLVLSDLHHESADTDTLYRNIAALAARAGVTRLIGVGPAMSAHAAMFPMQSLFFHDTPALLAALSTSDFADEAILLKGSPEFCLDDVAEMLETRRHETVLEVNLDALVNNFNYFRRHLPAGTGVVCMVKASGYGAGSYEIAKTLQDCGAAYLAVAVLDEGIELRQKGITMPIMVMNPKVVNYRSMFANRLEPEIYSFEMLRDVIREARKNGITGYPIHIKLDTGMHRLGFLEKDLDEVVDILRHQHVIRPASVFSHLAAADCPDMDDYTYSQFELFDRCCDRLQSGFRFHIMRHILNSTGISRFPEHQHDLVRLGICLYGIPTMNDGSQDGLRQVSSLTTTIISIKEWPAGTTIGYSRRGLLKRPSRVATIPVGYADGINRHLGNGGMRVMINGVRCPSVGNVCMDACMIDVTDTECQVGDRVEIFGPHIPVQELSDALDTIPYEVLTSISTRVKRVYFRE